MTVLDMYSISSCDAQKANTNYSKEGLKIFLKKSHTEIFDIDFFDTSISRKKYRNF